MLYVCPFHFVTGFVKIPVIFVPVLFNRLNFRGAFKPAVNISK